MIGGSASNFVDVAVCHPTAPYRVAKNILPRNPNDTILHAIDALADLKTRKYSELARRYHATFLPFVCDVYGAMGPGAHELVRWMISEASRAGIFSTTAEFRSFSTTVYTHLSLLVHWTALVAFARMLR